MIVVNVSDENQFIKGHELFPLDYEEIANDDLKVSDLNKKEFFFLEDLDKDLKLRLDTYYQMRQDLIHKLMHLNDEDREPELSASEKEKFWTIDEDATTGGILSIIFPKASIVFSVISSKESASGKREYYIQDAEYNDIEDLEYDIEYLEYDIEDFDSAKEAFEEQTGFELPYSAIEVIDTKMNDFEGSSEDEGYVSSDMDNSEEDLENIEDTQEAIDALNTEEASVEDDDITRVLFKVLDNEVIALFPDMQENEGYIGSYMHNGQHGDASVDLIDELPDATKKQYTPLAKELESLGYRLSIFE